MSRILSIEYLKKATGIHFVSAKTRRRSDNGRSYEALERETESKTHREMRQFAIEHFKRLGYNIYPTGIGVEGTYTLADFLAFRNGRVVFVECLTDAKANLQDIERKRRLEEFGEVCFVVIGGHGCEWEEDKLRMPKPFAELSKQTDVLTFYFGHWQNRFQKFISHLTKLPKTSFDIAKLERVEISISLETRQKTVGVCFEFVTKTEYSLPQLQRLQILIRSLKLSITAKSRARAGHTPLHASSDTENTLKVYDYRKGP